MLLGMAALGLFAAPVGAEEESTEEAAIISLKVNGIEINGFFEVLPRDTEILVPLVELANLTGTLVSWHPKEGTASFSRLSDGVTCFVNTNAALMVIGMDKPVALNPAPAIYNAMPHVPLTVIREALGYAAEWDFVNQVLNLKIASYQGDRHCSEITSGDGLPVIEDEGGNRIHGPVDINFSLSSDLDETFWQLGLGAPIAIPGFPLEWRVSLMGGSIVKPVALKELSLSYQSELFQLILGDYALAFPGYLSDMRLRGLAFGMPDVSEKDLNYQKFSWSGVAPAGATVQLYVDGLFYESQETPDGKYAFYGVPLRAFGTSFLLLKVINPDGSIYETIAREVSAAPLTEEHGSGRLTAAFGMIADKPWVEPETQYLLGADSRYGFLPWLTGRLMFVRSAPIKETSIENKPFTNNLLNGSLLFFSDTTSLNLDVIYGRNQQPALMAEPANDFGVHAAVRWSRAKIGIQGIAYYFGPQLYLPGAEKPENRYGGNLTAVWNPKAGSLLNFWYSFEGEPSPDSFLVHQLSLRYNQSFDTGFSFGAQTRLWYDPSSSNPWGSIFALAGNYFSHQLTAKAETNLRWSWSEPAGSILVFSGEASVVAGLRNASKIGLKLSGSGGASTNARFGGTLQYNLPVTQMHFLDFSLAYLYPDHYLLPMSEKAASVSAGITWRAFWQRNILSAVSVTGTYLAREEEHYELFPTLKVALSDKSGSGWKAEACYTARPTDPSLTVSLKVNKSLLLFPGTVAAAPDGISELASIVAGVVFRDDNGNGRQDSGEPGIPGLTIELGPWKAVTDRQGIYIFRGIVPGQYTLRVLPADIPIQYSLAGGPWLVTVEDQTRLWHEVPLKFWGTVSGYVYSDQNNNGIFDEADQPLPGIQVLIDGEPSGIYTDAYGFYYLEGLAIGPYVLTLDKETLPDFDVVIEAEAEGTPVSAAIAIEISAENPDLSDCDFGITAY